VSSVATTERHSDTGKHFVDRRRGRDWVTKAASLFTAVGWVLAMVMMLLFSKAQPETENFLTRVLNISINTSWNTRFLWLSLFALLCTLVICLLGIVFNLMRFRRKTDRINKPLIFLSAMSAIGIVLFLSVFYRYM
jgi:hypothetical protein